MMTEQQSSLAELIESSIGETIEAIGEPVLDGEKIRVDFQYGEDVYSAVIDPDAGTMAY